MQEDEKEEEEEENYIETVVGPKSLQKTISPTFFLYFSIILPNISFGFSQGDMNID